MAIGIPQNFSVQTANRVNLVSWDLVAGATAYKIQRSLDNVTFTDLTTVSGSPLYTHYLDENVTAGIQYWYTVRAEDGGDVSPYTISQSVIPSPTGEMSLKALKEFSRLRADRKNSKFVTDNELRVFINQSMFELYDMLVTLYEDQYVATPIQIITDGSTYQYTLPTGANQFKDANNPTGPMFTPRPFYKLLGIDLAIQNVNQGYVTLNKFNFIDRNRFVYPNTASTIYGVFNMQYRLMGLNTLQFIPTPSANQAIRIWYIPRLTELLQDTDLTDVGISGWLQYVVVRAAKYILDKEESDTSTLDQELLFLKQRIEGSAPNRDAGQPDKVSDTRAGNGYTGGSFPWTNGSNGGW